MGKEGERETDNGRETAKEEGLFIVECTEQRNSEFFHSSLPVLFHVPNVAVGDPRG